MAVKQVPVAVTCRLGRFLLLLIGGILEVWLTLTTYVPYALYIFILLLVLLVSVIRRSTARATGLHAKAGYTQTDNQAVFVPISQSEGSFNHLENEI